MESIEVYGKTIEEAVQAGAEQLGVTKEELEIELARLNAILMNPIPELIKVNQLLAN
jgi:predicted RNA-binding protein Jag